MRLVVALSFAWLLASCASEPPLRESVATPVAIGSLPRAQLGVWPLDRKPSETWEALQGAPAASVTLKDKALVVTFGDGPIRAVRYWFGRVVSPRNYAMCEPKYTIVEFARDDAVSDAAVAELREVGLGPTRMLGLDGGNWLTSATADPAWVLRWLDGRLESAVRAVRAPAMADLLTFRDVDAFAGLPAGRKDRLERLQQLDQLRQPGVPTSVEWHQRVDALCARVYDQLSAPHREAMAAADAAMASARTLAERLEVFRAIRKVVAANCYGPDVYVPPVLAWHARHRRAFLDEIDRAFAAQHLPEDGSFHRSMRQATKPGDWRNGRPVASVAIEKYVAVLEYAQAFAAIEDRDPYREFAGRLRYLSSHRAPALSAARGYAEAARRRFLARTEPVSPDPFVAAVREACGAIDVASPAAFRRAGDRIDALAAGARYLASPFASVEQDLGMLRACRIEAGKLRDRFVEAAATRLRRVPDASAVDAAVARAVACAIERADQFERTVASAADLLRRAREVPADGPVQARLDAYAQLATEARESGAAWELVAGELSVPVGRQIAQEAEKFSLAGARGLAALRYLEAATLGSRTAPVPTSTWSMRRRYRELQAARERGETAGRDERQDWLTEARAHAFLVAVGALPVTTEGEPVADLQDRFLRSQLAGRARLSTAFGLRLSGLADVRRNRKVGEQVRLVEVDGAIVWRRADAGGTPVDLDRYQIDRDGWRRYRELRAKLDDADADLKAAKASEGASREELVERDRRVAARSKELTESMKRGEVDPGVARGRLAELKRESAAIGRVIRNFNRRVKHINEASDRYNAMVGPHNELLASLLKQEATAYEQLLMPACVEFAEGRIAAAWSGEEARARRWILGLVDDVGFDARIPVPHPQALATRVRDVSDPAIAAEDILASLRRRRDDQRLWQGATMAEHLEALRGAVVAYGRRYGVDELFERVLSSDVVPVADRASVVPFFGEERRRDALQRLLDGK